MFDKQIPVYRDVINIRDWINVQDDCLAIYIIYNNAKASTFYN